MVFARQVISDRARRAPALGSEDRDQYAWTPVADESALQFVRSTTFKTIEDPIVLRGSALFYLWLPNPEVAIARVANRVSQGGHSILESDIRRRFTASQRNLERSYEGAVDAWAVYDNSGAEPILIDWSENS